jgi:hypothetical protein
MKCQKCHELILYWQKITGSLILNGKNYPENYFIQKAVNEILISTRTIRISRSVGKASSAVFSPI